MPSRQDSHATQYLPSPAATVALGERIAPLLRPGDMIALIGDLGAGKTTLARAVIQALSADDNITVPSPTFTLVQTYAAEKFTLTHADLFRLENPRDIMELGLDEALEEGAVLVEWPDRLGSDLPANRMEVALDMESDGRRAYLTAHGSWRERLKDVSP